MSFVASYLRPSLRRLRRRPLLSLTATFALAVGIALAILGFAAYETAVFADLPFDHGDRFVRFHVVSKYGGWTLDGDLYRLVRDEDGLFEHVGAYGGDRLNVRYPGRPDSSGEVEPVVSNLLTPSSLAHLPYAPILGRSLTAADGASGAAPVVVLREDLWQRRFGGEPDIVGRALEVAGTARTIVGVLPDSARFPADGEIWLPLDESAPPTEVRGLAILRPGVSLELAQARFDVLVRQIESERRGPRRDAEESELRAALAPFTQSPPGAVPMLTVFVVVLVLVLLVVAANIANLVLAQSASRSGELAIRSALGASRRRLVGEIFFDVLVMGTVAATLGLATARAALARLDVMIDEKPFWIRFEVGPGTMAGIVVVTLLTSAVAGAWPALRATRAASGGALRAGLATGFGFGRVGASLTVVELALSVGLLSSALVLAQGLSRYGESLLAFPHRQILTAQVVLPDTAVDTAEDTADDTAEHPAEHTVTLESLSDAVGRVDGVLAVGATTRVPGHDAPMQTVSWVDSATAELRLPVVEARDGFFAALGVEARAGRLFHGSDYENAADELVAVVNEPFVEQHLGHRNPIGLSLRWSASGRPEDEVALRVVGVVPDLGLSVADRDSAAGLYVPLRTAPRWFYLAMKTDGEPARLEQPLRRAVLDLDPAIQLRDVQPLARVGWDERAFFSGLGTALLAMGAMAMTLSLVGLFATTSLTVSRRRREIGLRVALGARTRQVVAIVVGTAVRYVVAGGVAGCLLAMLVLKVQGKLFVTRLPVGEPAIIPFVAGALAVAALAACWAPARRALRISPSEALRSE